MIVLHVDASPKGQSESRALGDVFVAALDGAAGPLEVRTHAVGRTPPALVTETFIGAMYTPAADRTAEQHALLSPSDALIDDLLAADLLLITTPMHNFGVPAALKAWIDSVTIKDRTFAVPEDRSSTANYKGLVPPKPVMIVSSVGGSGYGPGEANESFNALDGQLAAALRFIGLSDIRSARAEFASLTDGRRDAAITTATTALRAAAIDIARALFERQPDKTSA